MKHKSHQSYLILCNKLFEYTTCIFSLSSVFTCLLISISKGDRDLLVNLKCLSFSKDQILMGINSAIYFQHRLILNAVIFFIKISWINPLKIIYHHGSSNYGWISLWRLSLSLTHTKIRGSAAGERRISCTKYRNYAFTVCGMVSIEWHMRSADMRCEVATRWTANSNMYRVSKKFTYTSKKCTEPIPLLCGSVNWFNKSHT